MKDGTRYAGRLRKAYAKIKHSISEADIPEPGDPIRCLALGILGSDHGPVRAERQINKALGAVVDWNEIRVSNVHEVAELLGDTGTESLRRSQNVHWQPTDIGRQEQRRRSARRPVSCTDVGRGGRI